MHWNNTIHTDLPAPKSRWRSAAGALALAGMLCVMTGALALQLSPSGDGPVAAIFPPWWDADRTLAAAAAGGDAIVRGGGLANVIIVSPDRPGVAERLRAAGVWAIIDPRVVGGCSITTSERERS